MKKNVKTMTAMALVGLLGLSVSSTPVFAAEPSKNTDVYYTTHSATVDADGKVVMVVPARVTLNKDKASQEFNVVMESSDQTKELPTDFNAVVNVASKNLGKLKVTNEHDAVAMTKAVDYKLEKTDATKATENISLQKESKFADFTHDKGVAQGDKSAIVIKAAVTVEKTNVDLLEEEKPGILYNDTLTFKVKSLSGTGLDGGNIIP